MKTKQLKDQVILDFTLRDFKFLHILFKDGKIGVFSIKDMLNSDNHSVKLIGYITIKLKNP